MRLYVTIGILVILMLTLGIFTQTSLAKSTDQITANFDQISRAIRDQDWSSAEKQIDRAKARWETDKKWWAMVIVHQEIDNIDGSFAKTTQYIKYRDRALSSGELLILKQFLDHIPQKEKLSLKNVL